MHLSRKCGDAPCAACDAEVKAIAAGEVPAPVDWIDMAADGILSRLPDWTEEAGRAATAAQDSDVGEQHMRQCLVNYLRRMQANHSRAIGACRIALDSEEFRQGKRRRGWCKAFMEQELRAALKESECA